jgi:hypothetical protein
MSSTQDYMSLARAQAQDALSGLASFHNLAPPDRLAVYSQLVKDRAAALAANGRSSAFAGPAKASDSIDDKRHENRRIDQAGDLAGQFVENVDFPKFVRDLLKGVFDANLQVTIQQMESYQRLLKSASADISKFVNAIDNTAAFGYLAENQGDDFGLDFSDSEKDADGKPAVVLTNKEGQKLDIGDNEVKAKIMDAKIAMAKEQRALLRESILMGITRLVVERGTVKASVLFDIKATEQIQKQDKAALKEAHSSGSSLKAGGGLLGSIFGHPSGGHARSDSETKISISSAKSVGSTSLEAKLAGSVEIIFKSDYFKLDNFASMYSGVTDGDRAAAAKGGAPSAAPALPART